MNKRPLIYTAILAYTLAIQSCGSREQPNNTSTTDTTGKTTVSKKLTVPNFNADSAYNFVAHQVAMGPRNPGSKAQKQCADWMQQKLKSFCDTVYRQQTTVKGGDGKILPCINLIGTINPKATKRILLLTHWDSRAWADQDTKDKDKPILAADDAGSGVAVLLELARQIQTQKITENLGIDILLTDVEDYGRTEWGDNSYCLGTQYWAAHPHIAGYHADFGILLDMVGAKAASFPLEMTSMQYAPDVQENVYHAAARAGFSSYFPFTQGGGVTDDHKFVNEIIHIPTIDIINISTSTQTGFKPHWHTHQDNMDIIDKATLEAVGQTLLQVIYETAQNSSGTGS